uniref:Proheparin-binding EGF-like growth factor n=1 Tax=Salvator merianae TaxID=96440 RepID=A0A8D0DZJ6_SALMN
MRGLLVISWVLVAVCSVLVNGEETSVLQNEFYRKEGREGLANVHLLPVRETLEREGERGGDVLSIGANVSERSQVSFLSNPQEPVTTKKEGKGKKRRKGKGRKRNPCLRRYKDYCIHGECKYLKELKRAACQCQEGYHGERCHALSLPVEKRLPNYDQTTILAVTAVVLSSLCLLIIAVLLMLRCHKRGVYDVENEEKVKLGITVTH